MIGNKSHSEIKKELSNKNFFYNPKTQLIKYKINEEIYNINLYLKEISIIFLHQMDINISKINFE